MDTLIGKSVSHYRIIEKLGRGGMGEVYRAHDTRLGRDVALKALPVEFSSDRERLARFEREAKVLASLSHANLAGIYGVEEANGQRFLALELVQGETLGARLARGPLSPEDTIEICLQIASGMEAAHEGGVVHRDLKPANVMITPGDLVKVVDFGLAKGNVVEGGGALPDSPALSSAATVTESPAMQHSPVVGTPTTMPGVILGTAAYLSPEQARGKAVDRRTDIWSFGCVMYECVTGRRAFEGETVSDLVAGILRGEIDWSLIPRNTPPRLLELMQRCLERDPRRRLRDMGDARLELEDIRDGKGEGEAAAPQRLLSPRTIAIAMLPAILGAAAGISLWNGVGPGRRGPPGLIGVRRSSIEIEPGIKVGGIGLTSPNGRVLVVWGRPAPREGEPLQSLRLYRRRMDNYRFEPIEGSEGIYTVKRYTADGRWLYFTRSVTEGSADLRLMKTLIEGGAAPVAVANWDASWDPASWAALANGDVLVGIRGGASYVRVPANGAAPSAPIEFKGPGGGVTCHIGVVLPGDRGVLLNFTNTEGGRSRSGVGLLEPKSGRVTPLIGDGQLAQYAPTGHLVFQRRSTLLAVPFDLKTLRTRGEAVAVLEGVSGGTIWTLSGDGTLIYEPGTVGGERRHLVVADAQGRATDWTRDLAAHSGTPVVSPDGVRVAYAATNSKNIDEIWISERGDVSKRRLVAAEGADCRPAAWSPDGRQIAYTRSGGNQEDGVYVLSMDGGASRRIWRPVPPIQRLVPTSWSLDGGHLLADAVQESGTDVVRIAVESTGDSQSTPEPLLAGTGNQEGARYSPDGRHVAYRSEEAGRSEVLVAPCRPDGSLGPAVAVGRGAAPRWSRTGRELFLWQGGDEFFPKVRVMSVALRSEPALSASPPVPRWDLVALRDAGLFYDVLPGDQIILVKKGDEEAGPEVAQLACVFNFFGEMKQRISEAQKK